MGSACSECCKKTDIPDYETIEKQEATETSAEKRMSERDSFLTDFREQTKLNSVEFMKIWKRYDKDHSGQLDTTELENFLKDLLKRQGETVDAKTIKVYKEMTLQHFDANKNNRIDIDELACLLPVEENFLNRFPIRKKLTREDFNEIFKHYDIDGSRLIGDDELMALLRDLFKRSGQSMNPNDLEQYMKAVKEIYDIEKDQKLSADDIGLLLSKAM